MDEIKISQYPKDGITPECPKCQSRSALPSYSYMMPKMDEVLSWKCQCGYRWLTQCADHKE